VDASDAVIAAAKVAPSAATVAYGDPGSLLLREREECTRATAALVAAQRSLDEQQRRADGLQANLTVAQQSLAEEKRKVQQLQEALGSAAGDKGRLDAEKQFHEQVRTKLDEVEKRNTDLEVELSTKSRRLEEAETAIAASKSAGEATAGQLQRLRDEVAELGARGAQSMKKLETLAAERDALEKQSRELKAELAEHSQAAEKARGAVTSTEAVLRAREAEKVQVAQELATVRADRDRLEAEKVELEVKWRNTGHERDAEARKAAALRSQAEQAGRQGARLQDLARLLQGLAQDCERGQRLAEGREDTAPGTDTVPVERLVMSPERPAARVLERAHSKENSQSLANGVKSPILGARDGQLGSGESPAPGVRKRQSDEALPPEKRLSCSGAGTPLQALANAPLGTFSPARPEVPA